MFSKNSLLLLLVLIGQTAHAQSINGIPFQPKIQAPVFHNTVRDKKTKGVIFQKRDTSCGGATLAMLLQNSMGISAEEEDVLNFVAKQRGAEFDSVTFNDMMNFADLKGVDGLAQFRSFQEMEALIQRGIPFIVRVKAANADKVDSKEAKFLYHFVVVKGIANGLVSISDPSLEIGNVQYTNQEFISMIDIDEKGKGKVFFLLPKENSTQDIDKSYIKQPKYYPFENNFPKFIY